MHCSPSQATRTLPVSTMDTMQKFTDLVVWQRAHQWVLDIYRATTQFPSDERFGLTAQLRKSSSSVPSNIAEGAKRRSNRAYAHFLNIAESSLSEAEYQLMLARDLPYLSQAEASSLLDRASEIARMLHGLRTKVETLA